MKHTLKLVVAIPVSVFTVFGFALAQETPSYSQGQYQQQFNPQQNSYQGEPQAMPLSPSVEPQQKTIPPQEKPPSPQVTQPKTPSPLQVIDSGSAVQPRSFFPVSYILYALLTGVFASFFWLGWRKWLKRKKETELPAEAEKIACPTCGGSGKITKKRKITAPCGHCKKTGIDICHHCGGTGRDGLGYGVPLEDIENYPKCLYCRGKGVPKMPIRCCMCKGKREEEFEESYEVPCPTCKGSGWIRNW